MNPNRTVRATGGFSLVELMIAMGLGLILLGGIITLFVNVKRSYTVEGEIARMQESARVAFDLLARDLRHAGLSACNTRGTAVANSVEGSGSLSSFAQGLVGYEGGVSTFPTEATSVLSNTDAVIIHMADIDGSLGVDSHNLNAASIHLDGNPPFSDGDVLAIASPNCTQIGIFTVTQVNESTEIVVHNTGGSPQLNCTKVLIGSYDCDSPFIPGPGQQPAQSPFIGGSVMQLSSALYYLRNTDFTTGSNYPALYRRLINDTAASEMVAHVQDMSLRYGLDTDNDGLPNRFVKAGDVGAPSSLNWRNVINVRMELLMRSPEQVADVAQSYTFDGTTTTPTDRYLRRVYDSTIQLRNRGLSL